MPIFPEDDDDDIARWLRARANVRRYWSSRHDRLVRFWLREWVFDVRLAQDSFCGRPQRRRDAALARSMQQVGNPDLLTLIARITERSHP